MLKRGGGGARSEQQREFQRSTALARVAGIRFRRLATRMDLNRHQFFFIGLMVLLIGVQFRYVNAFVLNAETTRFLAERTGQSTPIAASVFAATDGTSAGPRKVVQPPEWLSWCLISVGAVLCLHSLAMPRPG